MSNDSTAKTIIVATLLCLACSVVVSMSAVSLRPMQIENKKLDIKKNILLAAGLLETSKPSKEEILKAYGFIEARVVDLETGEYQEVNPEEFDARVAAKDPKQNIVIAGSDDLAGIKVRSKLQKVYFVKRNDAIETVILPVHGKGLWSTMYGFLALAPNTVDVKGFGFYEHGETPGLGGEVDNPNWKALWNGKKVFDNSFAPAIQVIKGSVDNSTPGKEYKVDGLSGATITARGVEQLLRYWLSQNGYGPFLEKFRNQNQMAMATTEGSL